MADMADMDVFTIGDRVEVRWKAKSFAAIVVNVHGPGKVDAVYDIDGSVGVFLTAEEHGLKLVPDEEEKVGDALPGAGSVSPSHPSLGGIQVKFGTGNTRSLRDEGGRWNMWALSLGAKDRNIAAKHFNLTPEETEDLKKESRKLKQSVAQQTYLKKKKEERHEAKRKAKANGSSFKRRKKAKSKEGVLVVTEAAATAGTLVTAVPKAKKQVAPTLRAASPLPAVSTAPVAPTASALYHHQQQQALDINSMVLQAASIGEEHGRNIVAGAVP